MASTSEGKHSLHPADYFVDEALEDIYKRYDDYAQLRTTAEERATELADMQALVQSQAAMREELAHEKARADAAVARQNELADQVAALESSASASGASTSEATKQLAELQQWKRATLRSMASLQEELASAQQAVLDVQAELEAERRAHAELAADRDVVSTLKAQVKDAVAAASSAKLEAEKLQSERSALARKISDLEDELGHAPGRTSSLGSGGRGEAVADELAALGESYSDVMGNKLKAAAAENAQLVADIAAAKDAEKQAKAEAAAATAAAADMTAKVKANEAAVASEREQLARKEEAFETIVEGLQAQIDALKGGSGRSTSSDGNLAAMTADELRELNHSLMDNLAEFEKTKTELSATKRKLADVKGRLTDELADATATVDDLQVQLESEQIKAHKLKSKVASLTAQLEAQPATGGAAESGTLPALSGENVSVGAEAVAKLEAELTSAREQIAQWQAAHGRAEAKLEKSKAKRAAAVKEAQAALDESSRLEAEKKAVAAELAAARAELDAAAASDASSARTSGERGALDAEMAALKEKLAAARQSEGEAWAAAADAKTQAASAAGELESAAAEIEEWKSLAARAQGEAGAAATQLGVTAEKLAAAEGKIEGLVAAVAAARAEAAAAKEQSETRVTAEKLAAAEGKIEGLVAAVAAARAEAAAAAESKARIQELLAANRELDVKLQSARVALTEANQATERARQETRTSAQALAAKTFSEASEATALSEKIRTCEAQLAATKEALEFERAERAAVDAEVVRLESQVASMNAAHENALALEEILRKKDAEIVSLEKATRRTAEKLARAKEELAAAADLQAQAQTEKSKRLALKDVYQASQRRIYELEEALRRGKERSEVKETELLDKSRRKVEELVYALDESRAQCAAEQARREASMKASSLLESQVSTLESQAKTAMVQVAGAKAEAKAAAERAEAAEATLAAAQADAAAATEAAEKARAEALGSVRDAQREVDLLRAQIVRQTAALEESNARVSQLEAGMASGDAQMQARLDEYRSALKAAAAAADADAAEIAELRAVKDALLDRVGQAKAKRAALKAKFAESLEELGAKAELFDALQAKAEKLVVKYTQEKEKRVAVLGELSGKQAELEALHASVGEAVEREKKKRQTMMLQFARQLEEKQAEIAQLRTQVMTADVPQVSDAKIAEFNDALLNLETKNASLKQALTTTKAALAEAKESLKGMGKETPKLKLLVAQKDAEIGALRAELEVAMSSVDADELVRDVTVAKKREMPPAQRKAFIRAKELELSEEEAAIERLQAKLQAAGHDFVRMRAATREARDLVAHAFGLFHSLLEVVVQADKEKQLVELRGSLERREKDIEVAAEALDADVSDAEALHALSMALATLQDTLQIAQASGTEYAVNVALREMVAKVPIFDGVSDVGFISELLRKMQERSFEPGQFVIRHGELGHSMFS
ncbi:uncharacterized protein AMSG_12455 [Thecamonas trahens ATCC 50062]|uniref:Cyclic nucleotide-binding domain-containing protein n=1 Tax=Thecamonas trahens ATCC 50062 TaxID=461836 RepID=A0A0L0DXF4_THETB|nr:hypothetical protein AMSG_12455 [Thecamonas trahens ATCC 50062]KNC56213.1 hypothetical protein AMSG_12455 [Thecamonas trahens ATCC 50062]|eukprot:XP_013752665.1 hypothetical protein AMSG_12455 [Thecamonas trahens ATCC 50062]